MTSARSPKPNDGVPDDLDARWRKALDAWSPAIELARPVAIVPSGGGDDTAIAYIDLATRQTHVGFARLARMGVLDHVDCILAHEVGHHIRYPHTIAEARRMLRFLREIAAEVLWDGQGLPARPDRHDGLLNLFFDFLINDELSREHEASFVAIFRAMQGDWGAAFAFYAGSFEELWSLPKHTMVTRAQDEALAAIDPEWRSRAAAAGEFVRTHPENRPLQLARFLVALRPFVLADLAAGRPSAEEGGDGEAFERELLGGGDLDRDAVADLLRRRSDEDDARRWLRERGDAGSGPKKSKGPAGTGGGDPLERARLQLQGLAPPEAVALAAYRKEADRAALEVPASFEPGEPFVPGPHHGWELGDDLDGLDWIGSVARAGSRPIPGVTTLARTFLPDDPRPGDRETPWIELYVDSSGSMPDPKHRYSHSIEAGFVLVRAATRAGGRVRVIQYSSMGQRKVMPGFVRSALPAEVALLEYVGGGTDFPWDELERSIRRYRRIARVRRVVFSDSDFLANFQRPTPECAAADLLAEAAAAGGITGLLDIGGGDEPLRRAGMEVVRVSGLGDVTKAARALADALFRTKQRTSGARP